MRIFVVEPLAKGGMIHYAYQLCTALADTGVDVTLVTSEAYELETWPHNFKVEKQIRWWTLYGKQTQVQASIGRWETFLDQVRWSIRRGMRGLYLGKEWIRLVRYLISEQPDVVQFGKINFPFEAVFLTWLSRQGLFLTQICHEFELREQHDSLFTHFVNRMSAAVYNQFSILFLHGESNRQRFSDLFPHLASRTVVIEHGNESLFLEQHGGDTAKQRLLKRYGIQEINEPIILFFGNLTNSKGLFDLLPAFAWLCAFTPAKLIIAGYPTKHINMAALWQTAVDLNISDDVIFDSRYIPIEEVGPLMEMATVVAYPYLNSTQSGSLQAAYTFGRPVVATNVGGLPDVVENNCTGFLVPPAAPVALGEALLQIVNNPELAQEMGACAYRLSQTRFAWGPIGKQIVSLYRKLIF